MSAPFKLTCYLLYDSNTAQSPGVSPMRLSFITVTLLVAFVVGQRGTDNCDQSRFQHCTNALGQFWNTDTSMIWKSLDYMGHAVDSNIVLPYVISNFVSVCNGWSQFYACLGQFNIQNCLGTIGLMGTENMDPQTAYLYEGFLADWRFKCGGGFFMVYHNANLTACTQSTHINYHDDMVNAVTTYTKNVIADPNNACTYAQTMMNSFGSIYGTGCRSVDKEQGRIYGCQSGREFTNAQFTHCQHVTTCKNST